jgi:alcohol dehydrogenase
MEQQLVEKNGIEVIPRVLAEQGHRAVFLITGRHLQRADAQAQFLSSFKPFTQHRYLKEGENVDMQEVKNAYTAFVNSGATAIVAMGGGSVIDLAKGIVYQCIEAGAPAPFFAVAPTTAGSGSEATTFAVVYDNNSKRSLQHQQLRPVLAALDARLTLSLSPRQTAISGIDAVAQAIESYWNIHATLQSQQWASEALELLVMHLPAAVHTPDIAVREKVLWAAHLAGKAVNVTRTTGPHALSYYLTSHYQVPHGQAVALFLPVFFVYNDAVHAGNCNHPEGFVAVKRSMHELCSLLGVQNASAAAAWMQSFMKEIALATTLKELQIDTTGLWETLLHEVNEERVKNNPVAFNKAALTHLFTRFL